MITTDSPPTWLLLDYGAVVCLPQSDDVRATLAGLVGFHDLDAFDVAYWQPRRRYDSGELSAGEYWRLVGGAAADDALDDLVRADTAGWLRPDPATLALVDDAKAAGLRVALLSNAPIELAAAVRTLDWMAPFETLVFSAEVGAVKPDAGCYLAALAAIGATAEEVVFVDDRPANVAGAEAVGIRAIHFTDAAALRRDLAAVVPGWSAGHPAGSSVTRAGDARIP